MVLERRRSQRVKSFFSVIIHRPYYEKNVEATYLSLEGVMINNAQKYYDISQIVYLELVLLGGNSVSCEAKVVWVYPKSKNASTYKLGLQFLNMDASNKEKLKAYFASI